MKKLAITLILAGVFSFLMPTDIAAADSGCHTFTIVCPDGTEHYAVVCDTEDWYAWGTLLCGIEYED